MNEDYTNLRVSRSVTNDLIYVLENAANRLQKQADACRGTVVDDWKSFGLQREADAVKQSLQILLLAVGR